MRHVFFCAGCLNSEARTKYYVPYVFLLMKKAVNATCNTCIQQTGKFSFIPRLISSQHTLERPWVQGQLSKAKIPFLLEAVAQLCPHCWLPSQNSALHWTATYGEWEEDKEMSGQCTCIRVRPHLHTCSRTW